MANPPKQKGTGGETELVRRLEQLDVYVTRTPASSTYDLHRQEVNLVGKEYGNPVEVLATRPDRGDWLVTMRLVDFAWFVHMADAQVRSNEKHTPRSLHIEVKRYAKFALHTIFVKKFGRGFDL